MPEYRVNLDPCNPGQYFACCGLFELSELAAPGGEAGFADEGRAFVISTVAPLPPQSLELEPRQEAYSGDLKLEALVLRVADRTLTLNWWRNHTMTDKSLLKTWGGPQTPRRMLDELIGLLDFDIPTERLAQFAVYTKSRFGVDGRSAWEALDTGYSPNDFGQSAITFPWIEVLAVAGLQGFRPAGENRSYRYTAWYTPLTLASARAACAAPWQGLPSRTFGFEIATRGQGYKTFLFAKEFDRV